MLLTAWSFPFLCTIHERHTQVTPKCRRPPLALNEFGIYILQQLRRFSTVATMTSPMEKWRECVSVWKAENISGRVKNSQSLAIVYILESWQSFAAGSFLQSPRNFRDFPIFLQPKKKAKTRWIWRRKKHTLHLTGSCAQCQFTSSETVSHSDAHQHT